MNNNIQISTRVRRLFHYLEDLEKGIIQVPPFQRDFVWSNNQKLQLFDSIKNGYPIGSIHFWRPNNDLEIDTEIELQTVGAYKLPPKKADFFYILDGYQRLSTLFGCLVNPAKTDLKRDSEKWNKEFNIVYDLEEDRFKFNRKKTKLEIYEVPIYRFVDGGEFYAFQTELIKKGIPEEKANDYLNKYRDFGTKVTTYDIPSIDLIGGNFKMAIDIFWRLNSRGKIISNDWKISALSYNVGKGFRLGSEIDKLFDRIEKYNFFNGKNDKQTKRKIILQCITNSFGEIYFDALTKNDESTLERLAERDDFSLTTRETFAAIEKSVAFLFKKLNVLNSKLLPYNSQFIFITDFFNKIENPTQTQFETLKNWFWITTYSNYFTRYNLSKQRIAYERFQDFIRNEKDDPVYYDRKETFEALEFPDKISMGSVRAKALALFMLNYQIEKADIDPETLNGYKTYKLFKDKGNISENTILVIDDSNTPIPKSKKDLSHWLDSPDSHKKFFISRKMKDDYKNGVISPSDILARRKTLLLKHEQGFIESFGLKYIEEQAQI